MIRRARVAGRCYRCGRPVMAHMAARVLDHAVLTSDGRPIRRLAHAGECAAILRGRFQIGGGYGSER